MSEDSGVLVSAMPVEATLRQAIFSMFDKQILTCIDIPSPVGSARYTVLAVDPVETFSLAGAFVTESGHTNIDTPLAAFERFSSKGFSLPCDRYSPCGPCVLGYIGLDGALALNGYAPANGFSRIPQVSMGMFNSVMLFDSLESNARVLSIQGAPDPFDDMPSRLKACEPPAWMGFNSGITPSRSGSCDAALPQKISAAREWLRAESVESLFLVSCIESPSDITSSVDDFMSLRNAGSHAAIFKTRDAAVLLAFNNSHSFHSDSTVTGVTRATLNSSMVGTPIDGAARFHAMHNSEERSPLGGAVMIGTGQSINTMHISEARVYCDDVVKTYSGFRLTAETTDKEIGM